MNMKKMKKFFTLARRHDGFTLVELIVVIAILAILGGVAVPAYSGYVKKANMQADISLAAEVADALTLYYYSHPGEVTNGYVILKPNGAVADPDDDGIGEAAMKAVFGENWENVATLKYDGWKNSGVGANFTGSTFNGNEDALLDTVNELTDMLGKFLDEFGTNKKLNDFLDGKNIDAEDSTAAANAAVLYVSDKLSNANQDNISAILADVPNQIVTSFNDTYTYDSKKIVQDTTLKIMAEVENDKLAAAAVMYAYAESYALATGQTLTINPENITSGKTGLAEVERAFADLMDYNKIETQEQLDSLMNWGGMSMGDDGTLALGENAPYKKDAQAILSAMNAVNNVSDTLLSNINDENLYSNSKNLVKAYLNASALCQDGQVLVMINDGELIIDGLTE